MPKAKASRPSPKLLGNRGEIAFMHRAAELGFTVCQPLGDCARYDVVLDGGSSRRKRLHRVQVRVVTFFQPQRCFGVQGLTCSRKRHLNSSDADFLAVWVRPLDAWYIIPARNIKGTTTLWLFPHNPLSKGRWEPFREAWHLLRPPDGHHDQAAG